MCYGDAVKPFNLILYISIKGTELSVYLYQSDVGWCVMQGTVQKV